MMQLVGYERLALVGPMASGKTTLGRLLAKQLGLRFIDSDHEIERRSGVSIATIFDIEGEEAFRDREERTVGELMQQAGVLVATGGGAVLREQNRIRLKSDSLVVFLNPDLDVQVRRTALDRKRPLLQGQDRRAVLTEMRASRYPLYREVAHLEIAVDNRPGKKMTDVIVNLMDKQGWIARGT
jgi:shikimate kinase